MTKALLSRNYLRQQVRNKIWLQLSKAKPNLKKSISGCLVLLAGLLGSISAQAQVSSYSFAASSGGTLEDMSSGTTQLLGSSSDDGASTVQNIGFTFNFNGTNYTQFSANANGLMRLGSTAVATAYTNNFATTATGYPMIAPYWDDLATGSSAGGGKVHYKLIGTSPSRTLIVEWFVTVPRGTSNAANARFQVWLTETTNSIKFVYGNGMVANTANSGASIGLAASASDYISITASTNASSTTAINNTNTAAISSGTVYTFTPPACVAPGTLSASNVTTTSATLSWAAAATATSGYSVRYKATSDAATVSTWATPTTVASGTSLAISGLTPNTSYEFQVMSNCGTNGNSAFSSSTTFTTLCNPVTSLPLTESFESVTTPALPSCWTVIDANNDGTKWLTSTSTAKTGTKQAQIGYNTNMNDWLISPGIQMTAGVSYDVSFWYRAYNTTSGEELELMWGNAPTVAAMSNVSPVFNVNILSTTYTEAKRTVTPTTSGIYYFGWHGKTPGNRWYIYLDDIRIEETPACPTPTNLSASSSNLTSATLSWTAVNSAADGYLVRYKKTSEQTTVASWTTPIALAAGTTSYNLSGLTSGTQYEFQVQSVCGNNVTSSFSASTIFTTPIFGGICSAANLINISTSGTYSSGSLTTCGAGNDYGIPSGTSNYGTGEDYVFQLDITNAPQSYKFTLGGSGTYKSLTAFNGCPSPASAPTNKVSTQLTTSSGTTASGTLTFSTNGTYYIVIDHWSTPTCGNFTMDITSPPPAPANDECVNAVTLIQGSSCNPVTGTLYGSTNSNVTAPIGTSDDDVWYKFVATDTKAVFTLNTSVDIVTQLLSGTCGSTTSVTYSDTDAGFAYSGLTVGNTYYVRVYSWSSSFSPASAAAGEFSICITTPPPALSYNVARTTGQAFTSIATTGSTVPTWISSSSTDENLGTLDLTALGFTGFNYQGTNVTTLKVSTNGFVSFDPTLSSASFSNSFTSVASVLAPFWDDLVTQGNPGTLSALNNAVKYQITGSPGNQVLTVEWLEMGRFTYVGPSLTFQVKLYEATDRIEFVYGNMVGFTGESDLTWSYSTGINGSLVSSTPTAGEVIAQQIDNANNFGHTNQTNLTWVPECNTKITFTPAGTATLPTSTIAAITNQVCSSAIALTVGTGVSDDYCTIYRSGLNTGEAAFTSTCSPAVTGNGDDDVWFTFTTTQVTNNVVTVNGSGGYNAVVEMYSGSCGALTAVRCANATSSGLTETLTNNLLPAGTYYVRVYSSTTGAPSSQGTFVISTYSTVAPPANDNCNTLANYELTAGNMISSGNTANATQSSTGCSGTADDDVWYWFKPTTASAQIEVVGTGSFNPVLQVYSSSSNDCSGTLTSLGCINNTTNGGTETFTSNALDITKTYLVRVYHAATGATPSTGFNITLTTPVPACPALSTPSNNTTGVDPAATRQLTWSAPATITATSYDVLVSTNSNLSSPLISTNVTTTSYTIPVNTLSSSTVYYWTVVAKNANGSSANCTVRSFTTTGTAPSCAQSLAPQTGSTNLPLNQALTWTAGGGTPTGYDVYFGTSAGAMTKVVSNGTATSYSPTLAYGTTYYWSVNPINTNGTATGCSVLSFTTVAAPPVNDNCSGAVTLALGTTVNATSANATQSAAGCVGNADDDVWFKFTTNNTNTAYTITATGNGSFNPVIQLYGTACGSASIACSNANTTVSEVYNATALAKNTTYYFRVYNFAAGSGTFDVNVVPTINDLVITTNQNVSGTYNNVTVQSGIATVNGPLTVSGNLIVRNGATLNTGNNIISGGIFTLEAGGNLQIGSTAGISASGNTGNIQFTTRNFNAGGNYVYNGTTGAQVTGTGLPATVQNITVNNTNGVSLTNNLNVTRMVTLTRGNLNLGSRTLTLVSNSAGTAMVVNTNGIVNGTAVMQRYISAGNGRGYRHYASPVVSAAFSQLNDNGYTAIVNPNYNTLPLPTIPYAQFPTIFKYDESRVTSAFDDFTTGWASPASIGETMTRGRGFTVNIPRTTVDVSGTLNNGTVSAGTLTRGSAANSGWHLLGNPYPSPIDWNNLSLPSGIDNAVYVFRSNGTYTGQYVSYVNGVGPAGSNLIPAMQGFFVRVNSGSPTFSFTNTMRLTTYANPAMYRTTETRPLLQLNLTNAAGKTDELYVYQEAGATLDDDSQFDAYKVQSNGNDVPTLYSITPNGKSLSINGVPAILAQETVMPLGITVGTAGTYTFEAARFINFPASMDILLEDRKTGTVQNLRSNGTYTCQLVAGSNATRFALRLKPNARVSGTASELAGALKEALVYPNPTSNSKGFTLSIGGLKNEKLQVMLYNQVGQLVETRNITPTNGMVMANFATDKLAAGIYTLKLVTGDSQVAKKVIVQ